jgi:predicted ribosomally synthesized peptide with SipW-like signal peptide
MKKIGLLALTLIIALGALGIGYASWTDQINVTGTVNTGSVDLDVTSVSSTYVYKNLENEGIVISPTEIVDDDLLYVASAVGSMTNEKNVVVTFDNIFPIGRKFVADFEATYNGTIPVKVQVADLAINWADDNDGNDDLSYGYTFYVNNQPSSLTGVQLHTGDKLHVEVWIEIVNGKTDVDNMSLKGDITGTIKVIQWNEYVPTT